MSPFEIDKIAFENHLNICGENQYSIERNQLVV